MGWSSWSLQATNYPGVNPNGPASWLNVANVVKQADVMAAKLRKHGYTYVNGQPFGEQTIHEHRTIVAPWRRVIRRSPTPR
jgi:hypothetical protein